MIDASKKGHTDIVKRLIKENVDLNKKDNDVGYIILLNEYIFILIHFIHINIYIIV